jgi:hypothetical protein
MYDNDIIKLSNITKDRVQKRLYRNSLRKKLSDPLYFKVTKNEKKFIGTIFVFPVTSIDARVTRTCFQYHKVKELFIL